MKGNKAFACMIGVFVFFKSDNEEILPISITGMLITKLSHSERGKKFFCHFAVMSKERYDLE